MNQPGDFRRQYITDFIFVLFQNIVVFYRSGAVYKFNRSQRTSAGSTAD
jgi:hypothetical protein